MSDALELENASFGYGRITIVRDLSLSLRKGSVVSLLGPNGAGKTTTVKGIMGLVTRSGGQTRLFGERTDSWPPHQMVRRGLGFVPQGRELFPQMSVQDNLMLGAVAVRRRVNLDRRLEALFEYFPRLRDRRSQLAGSLSGGEQQMLAIARALMSEPRVLILDEPSAGLAPKIVRQVFETVKRIADEEGSSILVAEQNAHQALRIADYAYVLDSGVVAAEGDPAVLMADPAVRTAYLGESTATRPTP